MKFDQKKIEQILLEGNYVSKEDMAKAKEFATIQHSDILDYLSREGLITDDLLGQAVSEKFGVPYGDLNTNQPNRDQVLKIPEEIAKKFRIVIFKETDKEIILATDMPSNKEMIDALQIIFPNKRIKTVFSLTEDIDSVFLYYKKALDTRFLKIIAQNKRIAPEIIDEIVADALAYKASDIHFDPQEKEVVIRFRIDGVLQEAGRLSKEHYENILNLIKVRAHIRTDEHFIAQDGAIRYQKEDKAVDMRVSVVPILDGEKIVIRLLAEYIRNFGLTDLGLSPTHQKIIMQSAKKPFGMILVTGPTGSGKTTTLYALLRFLNNPAINITTIEDPVEYKIIGVNHIQVNSQTNLTFAQGLRSIIRQDPDVILVGEIRDQETAEISVNAALTGHLLFSTFHANDAASAIPRFLDMGVESFLLASTLEVLIAQRLVRKICEKCRYSLSQTQEELIDIFPQAKFYFPDEKTTLYHGKGCPACSGTGYKGRTAIFEIIRNTPELQDLILKNPSAKQVWTLAKSQGSIPLFEDGIEKVKNGITDLAELIRVANPPVFLENNGKNKIGKKETEE